MDIELAKTKAILQLWIAMQYCDLMKEERKNDGVYSERFQL